MSRRGRATRVGSPCSPAWQISRITIALGPRSRGAGHVSLLSLFFLVRSILCSRPPSQGKFRHFFGVVTEDNNEKKEERKEKEGRKEGKKSRQEERKRRKARKEERRESKGKGKKGKKKKRGKRGGEGSSNSGQYVSRAQRVMQDYYYPRKGGRERGGKEGGERGGKREEEREGRQ
jgi:hypothetical protein